MTAHASALSQPMAQGVLYLEIEGIPYAFGNLSADSSWFDVPGQSFEGIRPILRLFDTGDLPTISAQRVDFIESRVSIGTLRVGLVDTDEALDGNGNTLAGYVAPWRRDRALRLAAGTGTTVASGNAGTATIAVDDASAIPLGTIVRIGSSTVPRRVIAVGAGADTITIAPPMSSAPSGGTAVHGALAGASASTSASVAGDTSEASEPAGWPDSGVCWMGAEACGYTRSGSTLTLTRGLYRSRPAVHEQDEPVTLHPDGLVGRRCWLRWGLDAASDADCVDLFVGSVANAQWDTGGRLLALELEDAQSWLRRPLFSDLPERVPPGAQGTWLQLAGGDPPIVAFEPGAERLELPKGMEIVAELHGSVHLLRGGEVPGAGVNPLIVGTLYGTPPRALRPGEAQATGDEPAPLRPAIFVGGLLPVPPAAGVISGPHPLDALLKILTSTGSGENGPYDTLPDHWGLGVPVEAVDVAGIEEIIAQTSELGAFRAVILEPVDDFREWAIRTLLKPFGFYLSTTFDHPITIGRILAPSSGAIADATPLVLSDVAVEGERVALLEGPTQENAAVVGRVTLLADPRISDGRVEWGDRLRLGMVSSDVRRGYQSATPVEIETWLPAGKPRNDFYEAMLGNLWGRFEVPPSILRVAVQPDPFVRLSPGALVAVTLPELPSAASNTRGLDSVVMEVWGKSIDLPRNRVVLELAQTAITLRRVRFIGPACEVEAFGSNTLTVAEHAYTDAASDPVDSDAFTVGPARVASADFTTEAAAAIAAIPADDTVVLASGHGVTPAAGWHLVLADYDDAVSGEPSRYSYVADEDARLGAAGEAPHVHA